MPVVTSEVRSRARATDGSTTCTRAACSSSIDLGDVVISKRDRCCDEGCLDTIAQRECEAECTTDVDAGSCKDAAETGCCGGKFKSKSSSRSACSRHKKTARERYGATLEALGCICKALLARNLESCCNTPGQSPHQLRSSASSLKSFISLDQRASSEKGKAASRTSCKGSVEQSDRTMGCCGTANIVSGLSTRQKPQDCSDAAPEPPSQVRQCGVVTTPTACCSTTTPGPDFSSSAVSKGCCASKPETVMQADSCCASATQKGYCSTGEEPHTNEAVRRTAPSSGKCCAQDQERGKKASLCRTTRDPRECQTASKYANLEVPSCSKPRTSNCCSPGIDAKMKPSTSFSVLPAKNCCSSMPKTSIFPANSCTSLNINPKQDCCSTPSSMQDACSKVDRCSAMTLPSEKEISMVGSPLEIDLERGATGLDHVILNVHGMTCVGCETKLSRSLLAVPALKNVQTSLVLGRAEFDFDNNVNSVENIMRIIEKATGFSCEKLTTTGQELDVILRGNIAEFINQTLPLGVYDMVPLDKHTVRIVFNPSIIGARELFERSFDASIQLAPLRPHASLEAGKSHVRNTGLMTVFSAACTIPVLVLAWAPLPERHIQYGGASLALATIVQFVVAGPFYPSALRSLIFTRVIEMDLLIVLSTTAAYVFSVVAFAYEVHGRPLSTGQFFETSTLLVTLIMLGRYISAFARQKAVESISIRSLQPSTALLLNDDGSEQEVDVRLLQHGDNFRVSPESRVTTDGVVLTGISEIDESMVTGEAKLVEKQIGSSVIAGSVNGSGPLVVKLTRLPSDNTISTIATMVDDAKFSKPKTQEIADRVAGYFVPVVVVFCMITFGIWVAVGIEVRKQSGSSAAVNAITYAIAVLIVSCPCAIGLAVPMVIVIAGGVAAKNGVIFRTAETIEIARNVTHVVFDKTGTLTQGHLSVRAEEYATDAKEITQSIVLGIASNIKHPVAAAVTKHLTSNIKAAVVEDVKSVPGCGIEGIWNGAHVRAGNSRWLNLEELPTVKKLLTQGLTVFCVVRETETVAIFGLQDSIRPDAYQVVSELKRRGIDVSIVSGDDTEAVHSVGAELGFPISNVKSRCSPKSKQDYIKDAMVDKDTVIMFCGDGTNDAVALAQAHIGVHMNEGTDVAQSAADAILMRPSLFGIITLIDLSRAAFNRIVFNFTWAFVYNLFAILLAGGAFVNARISPEYAGLGEIVSVLPVILIALQLRWAKF